MSLCLTSASRRLSSSMLRQYRLSMTCRFLTSSQYNNDLLQAQKRQSNSPDDSSMKASPRFRRFHYYLISIATGALIGTIYALRQVRKHEGVLPEYVTNVELLERKALEQRPVPAPVTKKITFNSPPRVPFPYKLTIYQYVTWLVRCLFTSNEQR
jgi:hypothetical protein